MKMAISLAERGRGFVSPNPLAGAILVRGDRVVGRGVHKEYGKEHAEAAAIEDAGEKARDADLYVTLEPCNHYGKQPPCTKAILEAGIKRVFAAIKDPNPVSKHGAAYLRKKGVFVELGMCEKEAEKQNEFYIKSVRSKRPFVTLKIAMTEEGFITWGDGKAKQIGGRKQHEYTQKLRADYDAVLVGLNTIIKDDPRLAVYDNPDMNPVRVILDSEANTPLEAQVLKERGRTLIACTERAPWKKVTELWKKGAEMIIAGGREGDVGLARLMDALHARKIQSVLVEAGNRTATSFLSQGLFDRIIIIVCRKNIKEGTPAFGLAEKIRVRVAGTKKLGKDLMLVLEK